MNDNKREHTKYKIWKRVHKLDGHYSVGMAGLAKYA